MSTRSEKANSDKVRRWNILAGNPLQRAFFSAFWLPEQAGALSRRWAGLNP